MTSITRKAKQILYHRYPDGWLHAGFALLFGTVFGILALMATRAEGLTPLFFLTHILPLWILAAGLFAGAFALMTARRWGLLLLGMTYAVITVWLVRTNSILFAFCFAYWAWAFIKSYRTST